LPDKFRFACFYFLVHALKITHVRLFVKLGIIALEKLVVGYDSE
jgi:hypothetical protein